MNKVKEIGDQNALQISVYSSQSPWNVECLAGMPSVTCLVSTSSRLSKKLHDAVCNRGLISAQQQIYRDCHPWISGEIIRLNVNTTNKQSWRWNNFFSTQRTKVAVLTMELKHVPEKRQILSTGKPNLIWRKIMVWNSMPRHPVRLVKCDYWRLKLRTRQKRKQTRQEEITCRSRHGRQSCCRGTQGQRKKSSQCQSCQFGWQSHAPTICNSQYNERCYCLHWWGNRL